MNRHTPFPRNGRSAVTGRHPALLAIVTVGILAALGNGALAAPPAGGQYPFAFRDVTAEAGLLPHIAGIRSHAAAWGDVDGDGWIDLYVGNFQTEGNKPNLLLRNSQGKFRLDDQEHLRLSARSSGAVFADLDNDGDLDLYVSNLSGGSSGAQATPCALFRNDGGGRFTDISRASGACPAEFRGRSVTVLDFDGDGELDLLLGESVSYGSSRRSRLMRNQGKLRFDDVSDAAGLPAGIPGMGVAAADVNNDGWPDIFLAADEGGNRLLVNDRRGKFYAPPGTAEVFTASWDYNAGDDTTAGVCFGDLNRDGLLDIVIGQHFKRPWIHPVAVRLYLNRGVRNGNPVFEDVTEACGLRPLPMKAPHVEIQDFDNDGWPDLYVSIVKFVDRKPYPVIYKNLGVRRGLPQLREDAMAVNDYPTAQDRQGARSRDFAEKMIAEKKILYMAPAPSGDYDNDGRLDLLMASFWVAADSLLLRNETRAGNWLQVEVQGPGGVNRMGIGAKVRIYPAGKLGQPSALLGCQDIAAAYGYSSGQAAVAHFGLGQAPEVDAEVTLPHGKGVLIRRGVPANQRLTVRE